ncbi:putative PEP-binding protein [Paenibacillus pabuli]|uniref:putative PEP-binding protein n=1 Tax=Paenibacillus pabuli TaxID=1472 RepID=UPI000780B1D5|nr:putative PEP-binding protein [Paenibacillus pabuli]MEC0127419.1 PEP/pyruvate-binding domain-containing protein [Paenibacillus pabuli]
MTKRVILLEEGTTEMKGLMGSKGAGLAALLQAGWSVPAGFIVTTEGCRAFCTRLGHLSTEGVHEISSAVQDLEKKTGKFFGDSLVPLLLAVRSSETHSHHAESHALLHVGLNDVTVEGLARQTNDRPYALNCYRILLQDYGHLVHNIPYALFEEIWGNISILDEAKLEFAIAAYKHLIEDMGHHPFPQDVQIQLEEAIRSVSPIQRIPRPITQQELFLKTTEFSGEVQAAAVLVQVMVNSERGDRSGIGTVYSRHPVTGERGMAGEYISSAASQSREDGLNQLRDEEPELYGLLQDACCYLESRMGEVQEIHFAVDSGELYLVEIRQAKLTSKAALRSTVDLVDEGKITKEDAIMRIQPWQGKEMMQASSTLSPELQLLLEWADEIKELTILSNVDHPQDAITARAFGAEGIGLCRTEHLLMSASRFPFVQKMILADSEVERKRGLERLLPMQQADFEQLFEAMDGYPVTIRLLDLPLHELVPDIEVLNDKREQLRNSTLEESINELQELDRVIQRIQELHEHLPTLRHQDCRLGDVFPEIYDMQIEAIFRAAVKGIRQGLLVRPEILIPLVSHADELVAMRELVDHVADQVLGEEKRHCLYRVGAMIEAPGAALTAAHIARYADFLSFGTDDRTEMTSGYSRYNTKKPLIHTDVEQRLVSSTPFQALDIDGVGQLLEMALVQGRNRKPHLKAGICGENTADPASIAFCHRIGLDYVSCLPEQVPLARIAAAQAVILARKQNENNQDGDISTIA